MGRWLIVTSVACVACASLYGEEQDDRPPPAGSDAGEDVSADTLVPADANDGAPGPPPRLACTGKPFGEPAVIAHVNSTGALENGPRLSPDELVLYFHSSRSGQFMIYQAVRTSPTLPFGDPRELPLGTGAVY